MKDSPGPWASAHGLPKESSRALQGLSSLPRGNLKKLPRYVFSKMSSRSLVNSNGVSMDAMITPHVFPRCPEAEEMIKGRQVLNEGAPARRQGAPGTRPQGFP